MAINLRSNLSLIAFLFALILAVVVSIMAAGTGKQDEAFVTTLMDLNKIAAASGYITFIADGDGQIVCYGDTAANYFGVTKSDLVGKKLGDVFSGIELDELRLSTGKIYIIKSQIKVKAKDQETYLVIKTLHDHATYIVVIAVSQENLVNRN